MIGAGPPEPTCADLGLRLSLNLNLKPWKILSSSFSSTSPAISLIFAVFGWLGGLACPTGQTLNPKP